MILSHSGGGMGNFPIVFQNGHQQQIGIVGAVFDGVPEAAFLPETDFFIGVDGTGIEREYFQVYPMQMGVGEGKIQRVSDGPGANAFAAVSWMEEGDAEIGTAQIWVDLVEDAFSDDAPIGGKDQKIKAVVGIDASAEEIHNFSLGKVGF